MKQGINLDKALVYFLGGLLGFILALVALNILHSLEMKTPEDFNFFYHWIVAHSPIYAFTVIASFVLIGLLSADRMAINSQFAAQAARIKDMEEVSREKTEMIAFATHQMRTPLTAIGYSLGMFLDGDFGQLTLEQKDVLRKAYDTNENLKAIIEEFLDVSKLDMKKSEISLRDVDMKNLEKDIKQLAEGMKPLLEKKNIDLKIVTALDYNLLVQADLKIINQVVGNLLENAVNYTPSDGNIKVALESDRVNFECSVSDSGIGIPKEVQGKIFGKFFRAANAKEMRSKGTGLGLYLCKEFIEAHRGRIWFISEAGKGATFSFALPIKTKVETEDLFRRI